MPRELERIHIRPGLSIYREFRAWSVDTRHQGRRVRKSLAARDQAGAVLEAIQFANGLAISPAKELNGDLGVRATFSKPQIEPRAILTQSATDSAPSPVLPTSVAIAQGLNTYIATVQQGKEGNTDDWVKTVRSHVETFAEFCAHDGVQVLFDIREKHVEDWIGQERTKGGPKGKGVGEWSLRQKYYNLNKFFRFSARRGWMAWNPNEDIMPRKPGKKAPRFFTSREITKILVGAGKVDRELEIACAIAIYTGMRREEIFLIDWSQINLSDRRIEIPKTKTGNARTAPIFDQLVPFLFPAKRRGRLFKRWGHVDTLGEEANSVIRKTTGKTEKWWGMHILRHSTSTHLQAQGVAASVAADFLGHTTSTSERFYRGQHPMGERPLAMTFRDKPLERYGIPELPQRKVLLAGEESR
jgi:integrase